MAVNRRLALLIDADNAQADLLPQMLAEVSKYGMLTIRRIYGDWSEPNLKPWKELLHLYALSPQQQFSYTKGKNATDIALIIDAMDFLHTAELEGFCIASSDSDYTPLVTRIREKGMFVLGIGRQQTPTAFVNACSAFVYTENLEVVQVATVEQQDESPQARLKSLFRSAFEASALENGWAHLAAFGSTLKNLDPAFDPRTYGHKQLSQLVAAQSDLLQVRKETDTDAIYVRLKSRK